MGAGGWCRARGRLHIAGRDCICRGVVSEIAFTASRPALAALVADPNSMEKNATRCVPIICVTDLVQKDERTRMTIAGTERGVASGYYFGPPQSGKELFWLNAVGSGVVIIRPVGDGWYFWTGSG
jgi:hypothetical protein